MIKNLAATRFFQLAANSKSASDKLSGLLSIKSCNSRSDAHKAFRIPNRRTMALFDVLSERKKLWRFKNAGHNTLPMEPWRPWWKEAMQFIDH